MSYWDDNATPAGVFNVGDMYDQYTRRQAAFIVEQLDAGDDGLLIDLGCGIGRLTRPIAEAIPGAMVFGVDPSIEMRAAMLRPRPLVAGCVASLEKISHRNAVAHGAWCVLTFQHLPDDTVKQHLRDLFEILKPGARLVTQWVTEGEEGPMSYPRNAAKIINWHTATGFSDFFVCTDEHVTDYSDDWVWVTAEKPA